MKLGSFDIESASLDIQDPNNRILSISLYGDLYPDGIVLMYENEEETLASFVEKALKHDGLLGWNSDGFDMPLLQKRLQQHGAESLFAQLPLVLDCMRVHKHMLRKQETSNTLDHVSRKHLGHGKLPFNPNMTREYFEGRKQELAEYNLEDSKLVWELNKVFGYWATFDGIVQRAGLNEFDTRKFAGISQKEDGGFAWWRPIMGVVKKFCMREGRPVPQWPSDSDKGQRHMMNIERPGGFVETPKKGNHQNVIEFDFKSLYPTIIQSFNLGYDTEDPGGDIHPPFSTFTSSKRSTVAAILDELVVERTAVKKEYEERRQAGANVEELAALKGNIEALKIFNNSFYGQFYAPFSPLYSFNSARNITTIGQECVKTMLARMGELGLEVVAGDTDSTYVSVPPEMFNKEAALKLSDELTRHISAHLKEKYGVAFVGAFDFKSLLSNMAIYKKKFYARLEQGKGIENIELKGYVRGNTPEVQRDLQQKVFETAFSGGDIKAMLRDERAKFLAAKDHTGFISWMQPHSSKGTTAQARALRALTEAGVTFQRFEQVGFLLIGKGKSRRRIAAHWLPDSTIEWLTEGSKILFQEKNLLTADEAVQMWDSMVKKLDGIEPESLSNRNTLPGAE